MSSDTARRFGQMLRQMRSARGLSQLELANRAGLSENAISAFERAERFPRATTIDALSSALETDVDTLLGDVLMVREHPTTRYEATEEPRTALRQLAEILKDRPEHQVRLVLDVSQRMLSEFPEER